MKKNNLRENTMIYQLFKQNIAEAFSQRDITLYGRGSDASTRYWFANVTYPSCWVQASFNFDLTGKVPKNPWMVEVYKEEEDPVKQFTGSSLNSVVQQLKKWMEG